MKMPGFLLCILLLNFVIINSIAGEPLIGEVIDDTVSIKGDGYKIVHYHSVSRELSQRILVDFNDEVFDDRLNRYSRLIFYSNEHSFNIPTIPLTNIVFLENLGLIVGLSNIVVSPYQIVIYSSDGKLLSKLAMSNLEIKLKKPELKELLKHNSEMQECLSVQTVIVKENQDYYVTISRCLLHILGADSIINMKKFASSHYFPLASTPGVTGNGYQKYHNFFSDSDPVYDLIMIGSTPYLIILNSKDGRKVNIPFFSNFDVLKELRE